MAAADGKDLPARWLQPIRPTDSSSPEYREVFELLCSTDWATEAPDLGPLEDWCPNLRMLVQMMFTRPEPHSIRWGEHLVDIFNPAYLRDLIGTRRPVRMGVKLAESLPTLAYSEFDERDAVTRAIETASPVDVPEHLYFLDSDRCDDGEEAFVSHKVTPVFDTDSRVIGVFSDHPVSTQAVLRARKGSTLRHFVNATQNLSTLVALQNKLQHGFNQCPLDFPMCCIFLKRSFVDHPASFDPAARAEGPVVYRSFCRAGMNERMIERVVDFTAAAAAEAEDDRSTPMFGGLARRCHATRAAVVIDDARLTDHCKGRAYGHRCRRGHISPIYASDGDEHPEVEPFGFVLLGYSPCRPFDDYLADFASVLENLLITAFQNIQGIVRSQARLDEVRAVRAIGEKYYKILHDSPVGISLQNWKTHEMVFANARWLSVLGYAEGSSLDSWADLVLEEELPEIYAILASIGPGEKVGDHQLRLRRRHTNGKPAWISVSCSFHFNTLDDGQVVTLLATAVHDISPQVYAKETELAAAVETERLKAAQRMQAERADEADRAKARQLNYIDSLSHEIRNPISAIVQSVEVLADRLRALEPRDGRQAEHLAQSLEDLETIDICTTHMSRVINDALNVSKLEHGSLAVDLAPCDLLAHVDSVLRMLRQELRTKGLCCPPVRVDPSWSEHVGSVETDPLRYKQILLNLMTNAIKFTARSERKLVVVELSSAPDPERADRRLLVCAVTDSGRGMSQESVSGLFGKFHQESARTHVDYGGSGLGLFISQRLAALLDGRIDVSSKLGSGSTFTLTISARVSRERVACCGKQLARENGNRQELQVSLDMDDLLGDAHAVPSPARARRHSAFPSPTSTRRNSPTTEALSDSIDAVPSARAQRHGVVTPPLSSRDSNASAPSPTLATTAVAEAASSPPPTPAAVDFRPGDFTVLVVEDNLINQRLLVKQLRTEGYNVLVGNHGAEALEHFTAPGKEGGAHGIDLVLTDIEMPVMSGLELLGKVRALALPSTPPFFACSAYAREEQRRTFLDAGMREVIAKPFTFKYLKARVAECLSAPPVP